MTIEIRVPELPESVADATVGNWHKSPGESVKAGESLVDIETDKVVLEVPAPTDGVLTRILVERGNRVLARQLLAELQAGVATTTDSGKDADILTPSVRRLLAEQGVDPSQLVGTGKGGRITREDIQRHLEQAPVVAPQGVAKSAPAELKVVAEEHPALPVGREEKRVPMSRLRQRVAERLLEAKNSTAMLTTFNEVNMKPIMDIRTGYQERFEKRHNIKLGFM